MSRNLKIYLGVFAAVAALVALPDSLEAQGASTTRLKTYAVSLIGGLGGSVDESESGYDNTALQLGFSVVTETSVKIGARLGSLGTVERMGDLLDADLTYLTVAGEYAFGEIGYQSGVYLGLGVYRLEGNRLFTAESVSTTTVGLTGGLTGTFDLSPRVDILAELSFHGLTQGEAQFFASGMIGVAINLK